MKTTQNVPIALIVVPTRVLALQTHDVFQELGFKVQLLVGGTDERLDGDSGIIVGTPGRLCFAVIEK